MREFIVEEWLVVTILLVMIAVMTALTAAANYRKGIRDRYTRLIRNIAEVSIGAQGRNPLEEEVVFIKMCAVHTTVRPDGRYVVSVVGPFNLDVHLWVCQTREIAERSEQNVTSKLQHWLSLPIAERPGVVKVTKLGV